MSATNAQVVSQEEPSQNPSTSFPFSFKQLPLPSFPDVNLSQDYPFSHPVKHDEPATLHRTWADIIINSSPYNDLLGPIRVVQPPSAAAIAAKKMLAIKKKLGIPDEGLLVGYDPAATRTKSGAMPKKAEIVDVVPPTRRTMFDETSLEQAKGRLKRTRTGTLNGGDSLSSIGSLGKAFSVGDVSVDTALYKASQITVEMQEKLHGGRRGGVSDNKATKKVKRPLRLTEKDALALADMKGEVRLRRRLNKSTPTIPPPHSSKHSPPLSRSLSL